MLKTRITDAIRTEGSVHQRRHGVHRYRASGAGGVQGGRNGDVGDCWNAPDVQQAAIRDIKAADLACFGVDMIARFSGIEHIAVCVSHPMSRRADDWTLSPFRFWAAIIN
jgi:hypothetical protein